MKTTATILTLLLTLAPLSGNAKTSGDATFSDEATSAASELMTNRQAAPPDTVQSTKKGEVEDNPFLTDADKKKRQPVDSARIKGQQDYAKYIMDLRDKGFNEDHDSHWYDNMFLQIGAGTEKMIAISDNYEFDMLTTAHLGLGVQLGRYNTFRLKAHGALGYQKYYDRQFGRIGGQLEHLFDLSSVLYGYQTTRMLDVSTIIGVGGQYSMLNNTQPAKRNYSFEGHVGLQFRFYTGAHGYLNIEPYAGLASDRYDLNYANNWRDFDAFYGINFNYTYYFKNHLSRQAKLQLFKSIPEEKKKDWIQYADVAVGYDDIRKKDIIGQDSTLQSWQTPWFFEMAFGPNFTQVKGYGLSETMGSSMHLSVGKWFSPIIGVRFTASSRNGTWIHETETHDGVDYVRKQNMQYFSAGMDALLNPLGFLNDQFSWDDRWGAYLLAGGEFGWMKRDENGAFLHCRSEAYSAGLHLWLKLSEGTQLFMEPRFTHHVYKIPYSNANWNRRFSDNSYGIRIGLTAQSVDKRFWKKDSADTHEAWHPWTVGLGGGTSVIQRHDALSSNNKFMPYNISAFGVYRFGGQLSRHVSGIRLGLQFLSLPANEATSFIDYNMAVPEFGYAPVKRQGVWHHNYYMGIASLGYVFNFTNAMAGYRPQRLFNLEAFLGPGVAYTFGETGNLDEQISLLAGHEARVVNKIEQKPYFTVSGGAMLSARLTQRLGITFTPQIHLIPALRLPCLLEGYPRFIETFDLGVYYKF